MIYSKNISDIEWSDIENFCEQRIAENATLDYKKDFPNNLQKSIASFANTMGGIILIGVDEDDENKPMLPIEGIQFERGIHERVINIILSNITPPVFPEIQVCINSTTSKAAVIIRIPQSNNTPHAINKNTEVYVRTGNKNSFELLATVDKLFWLSDNRKKSISLGEQILEEAGKRFNKIYNSELKQVSTIPSFKPNYYSRLTISLSPCFPNELLSIPPLMRQLREKIIVKDYFDTSDHFPISSNSFDSTLYQNGVHLGLFNHHYAYYTELNCFGVYYYTQHLFGKNTKVLNNPMCEIRLNEVVARIGQLFESADTFYSMLGYNGLLNFILTIDGLEKFRLIIGENSTYHETLEDRIMYEDIFMKGQLKSSKKKLIFSAIRNLVWAYNMDVGEEYFRWFNNRFKAAGIE